MIGYEKYKLTHSLGFEKIPAEWDLKKVKYLFHIGRGRVISQEELMDNGLYPVFSSQTQNNGCLGYINTFDFDCDQLTWTTDGANAGTVFIRSGKHNCTNVCGTLQPITDQTNLKFSHYALQYATQFHKRPDTNGAKIMNNEMAEISFALPAECEQFKIIEYLDHETAKIDSLIEKQQQLIQLLKEKRQAVISHAVTKGLDPSVKMKDSGVEWLGDVPEHWEVIKMGSCAFMQEGPGLRTWQFKDEGTKVICVTNITDKGIDFKKLEKFISTSEYFDKYQHFTVSMGDILLSSSGNSWGKVAVYEEDEKVILNTSTIRLRQLHNKSISLNFLKFLLLSISVKEQLGLMMTGSCQPNFGPTHLKEVRVAIPETNEQIVIIENIENNINKHDLLIEKAELAIQLLQERRTALISAAVTGKIDVRNWQNPTEAKMECSA